MIVLRAIVNWLGLPSWVLPLVLMSAALSGFGAAYLKGRLDAAAGCREAELRAQIAAMQRDQVAQQQADRLEAQQLAALEAQRKELEEEVAAYEKQLQTRPSGPCRLSPDDIRALGRVPGQRRQ